ncbi:glycosyltransferase, partial [Halorubrum sp. AJ67]|uniref:glycosyltransferase family 2 protein n=1 Tax=Halorubrum sp. AJ67 TaxID=1173487 RepID=UPI0006942E5D
MPQVSALIPTYNRAEHVGGAIRTVLRQTYDDVEAVVVDDGSTDETPSVLDRYADDPRVVVRTNERNRGIAGSFNRAAAAAAGDLLCILGDDDRWHPEKVRRQVDRMNALDDEYAVVYTGGVATSVESGDIVTEFRPDRRGDIYPGVLRTFSLNPHSSHMIRRSCFEAVGGFDTEFPHGVDWEMNIRLARRYKFDYVAEPLVNRRIHDTNVSQSAESQARLYGWIYDKFAEQYRRHPEASREIRTRHHRLSAHAAMRRGDRAGAVVHCAKALRLSRSWLVLALLVTMLAGARSYRARERAYERLAGLADRFA